MLEEILQKRAINPHKKMSLSTDNPEVIDIAPKKWT